VAGKGSGGGSTVPDCIPLARPFLTAGESEAVARVLESRFIAQGPETAAFERELSGYVGGREVIAVSSGGTALLLALMAAGVGDGDEVVVPDYVFPAAAHGAMFLGAVPVPADVDLQTLSITPRTVARRLSARTRAVVVVHPFGIPADVEGILAVCPDGVTVIEDGACALGGLTAGGHAVGTVGRIGCFSFHPRKSISTGEGGCICADAADATNLRLWRDYGRSGRGFGDVFSDVGMNFRLSDIGAAVGRVQLGRLRHSIEHRGRLAALYMSRLADVDGVRVPDGYRQPGNTFQSFVVELAGEPALVVDYLARNGIGSGPAAHALSMQTVFRNRYPAFVDSCDGSGAELAAGTIALPLFDEMTEGQVDRVVKALAAAMKTLK